MQELTSKEADSPPPPVFHLPKLSKASEPQLPPNKKKRPSFTEDSSIINEEEREQDTRERPRQKSRKIVPLEKQYVGMYRDADVLCGRGGRSNKHRGNKEYLRLVEAKKPFYKRVSKSDDDAKKQIILDILQTVQETNGGRFLELDKDLNQWYIVHPKVAYTKVGQALRDNNDPTSREAKRSKYNSNSGGGGGGRDNQNNS